MVTSSDRDHANTSVSTAGTKGTGASGRARRLWHRPHPHRVVASLLLTCGAALMALPFIWMVSSSLKLQQRVFQFPPQLIPDPIRLQNYADALSYRPFHLYFLNTLLIVALNLIAILLTASFCAYGFARIDFRGRNFWFNVLIASMMLPGFVLMVPTFIIFSRLQWLDTYLPLTVPLFFGGGPFYIFLLRQFFRTIPAELADAARIDGCGEIGIYWRIFMPLAKPALATVAIFAFLGAWNDLLLPILYINSPEKLTIAIGLANFSGSLLNPRWELLMAAATVTIAPVILVFFLAQRYFVQGVVMSGLRG